VGKNTRGDEYETLHEKYINSVSVSISIIEEGTSLSAVNKDFTSRGVSPMSFRRVIVSSTLVLRNLNKAHLGYVPTTVAAGMHRPPEAISSCEVRILPHSPEFKLSPSQFRPR